MERILLVEDDAALARGIALALDAHERTVTAAQTAAEARRAVAAERFDLVLLDINLPDASGLELLRDWRANGDQTSVILLTANDMEMDEVVGLEAGANDYITKPFSLAVLRARVAVQLRTQRAQEEAVRIGPFHFDFARMVFSREGAPVELSKTEQRLLRVLVENRGHAVSRSDLIDGVWSEEAAFVEENALSVTVKRLRAKLERDPAHPQWLRTVRGIGYEWGREP